LADVEAILTTESMLAMRAYSKHDLEAMFELGMRPLDLFIVRVLRVGVHEIIKNHPQRRWF
jgi:hypothetical protein